jgi:DNA replication protein DnaC
MRDNRFITERNRGISMDNEETLRQLEFIHLRKKASLPKRLRPFYGKVSLKTRGVLVFGARGVGKTTFLLSAFDEKKCCTCRPIIL